MALKKALTADGSPIGVAFADAYHRVMDIICYPNDSVRFSVAAYADEAARTAEKAPVKTLQFELEEFDHSDDHSVKSKLYTYLKTLPEYAGATDV